MITIANYNKNVFKYIYLHVEFSIEDEVPVGNYSQ